MERRIFSQDAKDILQRATWYLHPARWDELFRAGAIETDVKPQQLTIEGVPIEEVEGQGTYDTDVLDEYCKNLDSSREMNGAALFAAIGSQNGEWV